MFDTHQANIRKRSHLGFQRVGWVNDTPLMTAGTMDRWGGDLGGMVD
jgi:hypothetical protein